MSDWLPDYKSAFQQDLQGMANIIGDTRLELGYLGRADGTSTIVNTSRAFNREMFYYGKVGGRPTPFGSARLAEDAGIFYENSADNLDLPVWIVNRKGTRTIVQVVIPEGVDQSGPTAGLTPLEKRIDAAQDSQYIECLNGSGSTALVGDIGYLDWTTGIGYRYFTTTSALDFKQRAVVVEGGANGAAIKVAQRGRMLLNYQGTAPTIGQWLRFSGTTAGKVSANSLFHYNTVAVAMANADTTLVQVDALLLFNTTRKFDEISSVLFGMNAVGDTLWTGTINGAPSATSVVVTTSTGALANFVPNSSSDSLKIRLRNTTRGNYRLVTVVNTGTNTITTVSSTDNWANGDALTIESGTCVSGGTPKFMELDFSQFGTFPKMARSIFIQMQIYDSSTTASALGAFHPFRSFISQARRFQQSIPVATTGNELHFDLPIYDEAICVGVDATGAATAGLFSWYMGADVACP